MNRETEDKKLIQTVIDRFGVDAVLDCIPQEKILDRVDVDDCIDHFGSSDIAFSLYYHGDKDALLDYCTFGELASAAEEKGDLEECFENETAQLEGSVSQDEAISPLLREALRYLSPHRQFWTKQDAIDALSEHINFWWH